MAQATCASCGAVTTGARRAPRFCDTCVHGTSCGRDWHRRRGEISCDPCRIAWNESTRASIARAKARGWQRADRPPKNRECEVCGKRLTSKGGAGDGRSLCKPHRDEARSRRRKALARRERFQRMIAAAAAGSSGSAPFFQGACRQCGEQFIRKTSPSPFCSRRCSRRDRRGWISDRDRESIYERDGHVCQLCFEPVDRFAHYLDDWSPTLDHIEPQSSSLLPDHSPENLRTAHRWCNSVRGDGRWNRDFFEEVA